MEVMAIERLKLLSRGGLREALRLYRPTVLIAPGLPRRKGFHLLGFEQKLKRERRERTTQFNTIHC